ncbi:MAG: hypothetical protein A2958_02445 [Candidatus Levybacteria bacterium RIFCSPLOWO2_01_FULL_38_13]|nr:MAG: hypothetical protein A2629_04075 [Candidatus Levybacteria bacterium RIFCSPHIGHO2_01_FULL_41_15]OGH35109.1 MAG: hypothetical protein A2958_02445 [Candidatus Levybacteria bacterium RIFCSPLOWO2_01_FULL_38_13]
MNLTPSQWADVWFAIKPPAAPTPTPTPAPTLTVSATPATCAQGTYISLSWNSVTGATSYDVWRQPPGGTWTRLTPFGGIAPTSYTDSSVSRGNSYNYQVYANSAGVWSNIASVAASDFAVCPTVSPTAPPTPTPTPCQVTTSPSVLNLTVGGATGTVTASVTSGLGSATINRMRFGSYNTSLATVNPTTDLSSPYSTQVMAQACGATAVWGTADLSDGRICQSAAATDTNINVTCPTPTPTSPPTPTPDSSTTLTVFSWNWDTGRFFSGVPITGTQGGTSGTTTYQIGLETNINTTLTAPSSYNGVPFKGWLSCNSRPSTYSCRKSVAVGSDATVIVDYQTTYIISGTVYMDTNENGAKDVGESNYSGGTTVTGPASTTTDISGFYSFSGLGPATYIISLTVPSGYIATTANPGSASLPPDGVVNFGIKPEPTYTISGNVFEDSNDDGVKNGTETNYSGSITISSTGGTVTYPGGGTFSVANLVAGSYTISHDLPSGYTRTYPTNGPPASFTVTVGPSCSTGGANSATCSSGNITSLNFGILSYSPWIQSYGTDVRFDDGFINRMPPFVSDPPTCGSYSSAASYEGYEKINPSSGEYDEGISFTGDSPSDFGSGTAGRHNGWVAGGTSNPEVYNPSKGVLPTSYSFVLSLLKRKGLTSSDISGRCGGGGLGNCQISSSLPLTSGTLGIYKADGNLNLTINTSPLFQNNGDYIILVNGNMTIKNSIEVQTGTTAVFVVSGNITVDKNVGTSDIINSTEKHLQGFYSTDKSFILEGLNNCPATSDKRLNVGGAVIVNAARGGGSFVNNRSLCDSNSLCPVFSVQSRADFIINAPSEIQTQKTVYQEVAP